MPDRKVWFITGAARGMGRAFVAAALDKGHAVVATGRRPDDLIQLFGERENLLAARLDVTSCDEATRAVAAAVERFGRIDVVVNNAGVSFKGYFEEMSPTQVEQQLATNLSGPMNVTRANEVHPTGGGWHLSEVRHAGAMRIRGLTHISGSPSNGRESI